MIEKNVFIKNTVCLTNSETKKTNKNNNNKKHF